MTTSAPARAPEDLVSEIEAAARTERTRFTGGGEMVWRLWGNGPPIVLLHGGYGSFRHYIRNIEPLSRDFTVVAPDMPGFGDSGETPGMVTVDWMAETVATGAREVLGQGTGFRVVGFSFGSVISSHMPGYVGDDMRQLIVVAYNRLGLWELRRPEMKNWREATTHEELVAAQRFNLGQLMFHDTAKIDDLAVYLQIENTKRSRIRSLDVAKTHDLPGRLQHAGIPVAAIWGEHDVTLRTGIANARAAFERLMPGAPMVVVDGVGHWVQYEAADQFNQAVKELVAQVP